VAQAGDLLLVRFVVGIYENGEEIEYAGRDRPIGFLLGAGDWSYGWESGMPGMRVGGRRELIFPTVPAFVPPGAQLGDTLVYVVDLMGITPPPG
jgi:peptidylprolyl isomerase